MRTHAQRLARSRALQATGRALARVPAGPALIAAALAAPVLLRVALLVSTHSTPALPDLRGALADAGVGCGVLLLLALARLLPWVAARWLLGTAIVSAWCVMCYGNYEHVRALGTIASFAYVGFLADRTFLTGSALHVSQPWLLGCVIGASIATGWLGLWPRGLRRTALLTPAAAALAIGSYALWPETPDAALWRQTHFLIESVRWAGSTEQIKPERKPIAGLFPGSMDGTPRTILPQPGKNVLLVILEGISGAYLDGIARAHGVQGPRPLLPSLDRWASSGLTYANFVNHQRQTNRGLYALLCGDLDKLITSAPKMSEYGWSARELPCLPNLLRHKGYETLFVQAAPLGFMNKDKFMPQAGFSRVHGLEWFRKARTWSQWGVDDQTFFERSLNLLTELRKSKKPFFLSLLTAGTHHPFSVPEDFKSPHPPHSFSHAVDYLDHALAPFLRALDDSGARKDTLIVFTSDESFGLEGELDIDSMMLAQAWGYAAVSLPSGERGMVREPFMQMDMARTIMDYLGYGDDAGSLGGRSLLRSYTEPRVLPFGNTYMRMVAGINQKRELLTCAEDFSMCRKHVLRPDALFAPLRKRVASSPKDVEFVKRAAAYSLAVGDDKNAKREWQLVETPGTVRVGFNNRGRGNVVSVFGNQYLSVAAGQRIEVDVELEVAGKDVELELVQGLYAVPRDRMPTGIDYRTFVEDVEDSYGKSTLGLRPKFVRKRKVLQEQRGRFVSGDKLKLHYVYVTDDDLERVEATLRAIGGGRPSLRFTRAWLRMEPADPKKDEAGLTRLDQ